MRYILSSIDNSPASSFKVLHPGSDDQSTRFQEVRRNPQENAKIYKFVRMFATLICIYSLCRIFFDFIKVSSEDRLTTYADTYWYRLEVRNTFPPLFSILGALDSTLSRIVLSGCVMCNMAFFICLSHVLGMRYDHLNDQLRAALLRGDPLSTYDIQTLRGRFARLIEMVSQVDTMYRSMAFFWFGGFLSGFCAEIAFFFGEIGSKEEKKQEDLVGEINFLLDTIYLIFWCSMLYYYPSRLYSFGIGSVRILQHLTCWKPATDVSFAIQAKLILSQVQIVRPGLTAWNFFIINRSSMINIITALVTYIVVVIQLHPEAVKILMQNNSTHTV